MAAKRPAFDERDRDYSWPGGVEATRFRAVNLKYFLIMIPEDRSLNNGYLWGENSTGMILRAISIAINK